MRWVSAVRARLRLLFHRSRLDTEMDAELHFHLDQQVAENEATGLSPREARRRALMVFGGVDSVKESCRDQRGLRFLEETVRDVRHGVRLFARSPALHGVAALTLALGIGANTAIFSVVHSVLLAELPFEEPERLVTLWENNPNGIRQNLVSPPNFNDWRATSTTFESLAAIVETDFVLTGRETPERIRGASVSPGFFDTLGLKAMRGRTFMATDVQPDTDPTVVVSEAYWRRRGEDPGLVGTVVTLQDRPRVIVGVVSQAAALSYVSRVTDTPVGAIDMWEPVTWSETSYGRSAHFLRVVGRLHPQTSLTEATAEMDTIGTRLAETYPDSNEEWGVTLEPLHSALVGNSTTVLLLLFGATGVILLIACANVAHLLLSRGAARRTEMSVRRALGAPRVRLIRQVVTEHVVLAVVGGSLGVLASKVGIDTLVALGPTSLPRLTDATITLPVLGLAGSLSLLTVFAASLVPALRWSSAEGHDGSGRTGRLSGGGGRTMRMLVTAEVAASVVLLVAAGLLVRSFVELTSVDPGFQSTRVLTAQLTLPRSRYEERQQHAAFFQELIARVRTLPAVERVGAIGDPPLTGGEGFWRFGFTIEGQTSRRDGQRGYVRWISPGYFSAMGIPLLQGRSLTEQDLGTERPQVVVVSQALVRQFFPGVNPIGQRVQTGFDDRTWREIVGVVGDVRQTALAQDAAPHLYYPYLQTPMPTMTLVVRSATDPATLTTAIRQVVRDIDPDQPIHNVRTTEELVAASVAAPRFATVLFGLFGALALLLTTVGIYGVVSYQVTQQTHDIAVRSALGASRRRILWQLLERGLQPVLGGTVLGIVAAFAAARLFSALLFGVTATDATTFIMAAVVLAGVGFLAICLGAGRVTRLDPMDALRTEQ